VEQAEGRGGGGGGGHCWKVAALRCCVWPRREGGLIQR
jgi:hypothetical protein